MPEPDVLPVFTLPSGDGIRYCFLRMYTTMATKPVATMRNKTPNARPLTFSNFFQTPPSALSM